MRLARNKKKKRRIGRPCVFKDVASLGKAINKYFKWAEDNDKPLTISRLAVFLEVDRKTILNYKIQKEFFPTIKKAIQIIEADKSERLCTARNPVGLIFDLKNNHNWVDKTDIEHSLSESTIDKLADKSVEELKARADALINRTPRINVN